MLALHLSHALAAPDDMSSSVKLTRPTFNGDAAYWRIFKRQFRRFIMGNFPPLLPYVMGTAAIIKILTTADAAAIIQDRITTLDAILNPPSAAPTTSAAPPPAGSAPATRSMAASRTGTTPATAPAAAASTAPAPAPAAPPTPPPAIDVITLSREVDRLIDKSKTEHKEMIEAQSQAWAQFLACLRKGLAQHLEANFWDDLAAAMGYCDTQFNGSTTESLELAQQQLRINILSGVAHEQATPEVLEFLQDHLADCLALIRELGGDDESASPSFLSYLHGVLLHLPCDQGGAR